MEVKHNTWMVLGMFASLLGACSDEQSVDSSTAQAAMRALVSSVDTSMSGYQSDSDSDGAVKLACASGGSADVEGHVHVAVNPVTVDVQLAIDYDACETRDGAVLSGSIDFTQKVVAGQVPTRVETRYKGDVAFSGKLEADCSVDVMVLVDEAGKTVRVSGSFCGHDAADLNVEVMPHWMD